MKHSVSGEVRELNEAEFLALFDESVRADIRRKGTGDGVEAVVCFENLDMWSSNLGHRTAMIVGPGCTYQLAQIETLPNFRLGDVPSRFQYPVAFWRSGNKTEVAK